MYVNAAVVPKSARHFFASFRARPCSNATQIPDPSCLNTCSQVEFYVNPTTYQETDIITVDIEFLTRVRSTA